MMPAAGSGGRMSGLAAPSLRAMFLPQLALLGIGALALLPWGAAATVSAASGGGIALLANAWFARYVFRYRGARRAREITHRFYRGQAGKMMLSAALLAALLAGWPAAKVPIVLVAFTGMHLAHSVCAARVVGRRGRQRT